MTAKSLILDLLSTMHGGSMPVALLVSAGDAFGIDGNRIRVAVTRMLPQGLVVRDERGHYFLGPASGSTTTRVDSWRAIARATRPWRGDWLAVHIAPVEKSDRSARRKTQHALDFFSFRELNAGLFVRPDNLTARIDDIRLELEALGADARLSCFRLNELAPEDEQRARRLWDVDALSGSYRQALAAMRESQCRLAQLDEKAAMVESFIIGGRVIRQLVLDPLLPDEIHPGDERRQVADTLRAYDKLGRACWAPLLRRHGVRVKAAPGRLGSVETATAGNNTRHAAGATRSVRPSPAIRS